jgi:hypothetical protein
MSAGDSRDVNRDGKISAMDALLVINHLNRVSGGLASESESTQWLDVNGDARVSASDALEIVNYLNARASQAAMAAPQPAAEGEADEFFGELGEGGSASDELLAILAEDRRAQRRKRK